MKKYIALGLLSSLLLTSCSVDWNDEKDKKIGELEKQVTSSTLSLQETCSKKSEEFFNNYTSKIPVENWRYTNHYNTKLDKCFILINGAGKETSNILFNVYENSDIADCETYNAPDMNFCGYTNSSEKYDLDKFNNFIKSYMEN